MIRYKRKLISILAFLKSSYFSSEFQFRNISEIWFDKYFCFHLFWIILTTPLFFFSNITFSWFWFLFHIFPNESYGDVFLKWILQAWCYDFIKFACFGWFLMHGMCIESIMNNFSVKHMNRKNSELVFLLVKIPMMKEIFWNFLNSITELLIRFCS